MPPPPGTALCGLVLGAALLSPVAVAVPAGAGAGAGAGASEGPVAPAVVRGAPTAVTGVAVTGVAVPAVPAPTGAPRPEPARFEEAAAPRRYGLPVVLALVLLTGVASLLVRVLLAEPAGRREARW